jgi:hypothetical protein
LVFGRYRFPLREHSERRNSRRRIRPSPKQAEAQLRRQARLANPSAEKVSLLNKVVSFDGRPFPCRRGHPRGSFGHGSGRVWYAVSKHKKSKKTIVMPESCRSGFIYAIYNFNDNYKSTNADQIFSIRRFKIRLRLTVLDASYEWPPFTFLLR